MFMLDLPEFADPEGTCRVNGKQAEYRLFPDRIEFRSGITDPWERRHILDRRLVRSLVVYVCDGQPPYGGNPSQAVVEGASGCSRSGPVAEAQASWDMFQQADGWGVVLTDDHLLAEFLAARFCVQPTDLYPQYLNQFDLPAL
jgi:hypothetical protein